MSKSNSNVTRRGFLTTAATGVVSAGVLSLTPSGALSQEPAEQAEPNDGEIIRRKIGRTGLQVPIVSMGIMNADNPEIIQAAYDIGMRHFNASADYQGGRVEENLGRVLKRSKGRDKVVVATGSHDIAQLRSMTPSEVKKTLISSCEGSLRRLGTDYLDILYIYQVSNPGIIGFEAIIEGIEVLKQQGKVRYAGVTTHSNMADVINATTENGFYDVVLTSINFTMADDTALLQAIKNAAEKGVGVVGMKVMTGGSRWPNPDSRSNYTSSTIATAAMKWVMRNENIATCIPGFMNYEHMKEDFSIAYNLEYNEQEKKLLADNNVKLGMGFCRQCRKCLASCPGGVDVPTLMRTHMYAAQYGDFYKARATLESIPAGNTLSECTDCSTCQAECANTVDISRRIDELKLMYS